MVKLKTVLDTRRAKADGSFTILFRITNHKEVKYLPSGISAFQNQWDAKSASLNKHHPNAATLNSIISKKYHEIQKALVKLEDKETYSFEQLKDILSPEVRQIQEVKPITFVAFSKGVTDGMIKIKRTGNALVYITAVNRLVAYTNKPELTFPEINYTLLDSFKSHLLIEGLRKNSIGNYFRSIRALYNKAIKAKVVARELYPFNDISIQTEKTAKRAIRTNELLAIYQYPKKPDSQEWHASNFFFLSFALRGISFTDMAYLTKQNIYKGCLTYRRRKTKKLYTIKLHPVALRIFNFYKDNQSSYLLPVFPKGIIEDSLEAQKVTRQWIKVTNKYLNRIAMNCKIDNNITTYVTRHTWATTAKRLGYPNEMIAEAMGHEYGNKITNIYLEDFDQKLIDEMNNKVVTSVIPCLKQVISPYRFTLRPSISLSKYKQQKTNLKLYLMA